MLFSWQSCPTLRSHRLKHASPSPFPRACSNSCHPTLSSSHPLLLLPSIFPSIRIFSNELALRIRWPKYWSFGTILPMNEYSGLISFKIDWFYFLAVQGTFKSLLQHHSSKASILQFSAFFMFQLTSVHDYWKNHSFDYMDLCQQSNISVF